MGKIFTPFILAGILSLGATATAQEVETLGKDKDKADRQEQGERPPRGPITMLKPAGLLIAGFDKNQDYMITLEEFDVGTTQAFAHADRDGSGSISLLELQNWREKALGSLDAAPGNFHFDGNHDSRISREEFTDALSHSYDRLDRDGDGIVNRTDMIQVIEQRQSRGERGESGDKKRRPPRGNRR